VTNTLEHHGIKGMRWGVRRDDSTSSSGGSSKPKKLSRSEVAQEQRDFYQKKADNILKVASKDPESLIALKTPNDAVIVTGHQFVDHMTRGGLMDIRMSDVWATKASPTGPYELNPNINQPFVRSDKRK
jgi:hypothetical protein